MGEGGLFRRWRRSRPDDERKPQEGSVGQPTDPAASADADRALATAMVNGLLEQVHHEQAMEDARGQEPMVVRLVPQVPIHDGAEPRSWLGGGAALPTGVEWPVHEGRRAMCLAQLCCADLPAELWSGLGPRQGWLVVFMHHGTYEVLVRHVPQLGAFEAGPEPDEGVFAPAQGLRPGRDAHEPIPAFPRWPLDLVAVTPGDPDPRALGDDGREAIHDEYRRGYDVADPAYRPFDWPSTLAMLDLLEAGVDQRSAAAASGLATSLEHLTAFEAKLAEAGQQETPEAKLTRLRNRVHDLPLLVEAFRTATADWDAARPQIDDVARKLRARSATERFTPELIEPYLERLGAIGCAQVKRGTDAARGPGAETIETLRLPITAHHPDASSWVHRFEALRFDWAKHAYAASPSSLPPAVRAHYEARWRLIAAGEMAGMGHVPFAYVHEFDEADDVTLLELPSSSLMSWMFGDVDHLVLTMTRADLAASAFDRIKVQWSN